MNHPTLLLIDFVLELKCFFCDVSQTTFIELAIELKASYYDQLKPFLSKPVIGFRTESLTLNNQFLVFSRGP